MAGDPRGPVVVGVDGGAEAARAAEYAVWEARRRNVPMRLVFAHRPTPMWGSAALIRDGYEWERVWAREALTTAEKSASAKHPDVPVESAVVSGSPAAVLVEESTRASLVVLGTRARGGLIGHLSGSVAAQVAAHAHTPVVILPRDSSAADPVPSSVPVVVGVDGSRESERAIDFAVDEAVARDADLIAVYVWNVLELEGVGDMVPPEYDVPTKREEEDKALRLLTEATEGWSDRYPDLKINRKVVRRVDAAEALAEAAQGAGLVVVGSRGHGGFLGLRLGSTVDELIRNSPVPVAVIRD